MSPKTAVTYRIQTQTPQLNLNHASKNAGRRRLSLLLSLRDDRTAHIHLEWFSTRVRMLPIMPKAERSQTGAISLRPSPWFGQCWGLAQALGRTPRARWAKFQPR